LARKTTFRGTANGMTMLSMNDRWLLATISRPSAGMCSRPSIVGRQPRCRRARQTSRDSR
jgi:hypothetical protein